MQDLLQITELGTVFDVVEIDLRDGRVIEKPQN